MGLGGDEGTGVRLDDGEDGLSHWGSDMVGIEGGEVAGFWSG